MLDVRRMRLLRELARLGTVAAVADALSYTPSAVSQQLGALEREAGVPLIRKAGRRVVLTPAGADLAARTEPVLALLEEAAACLAASQDDLAGELRIGAFPTAVRTLLPAALVSLAATYPRLDLQITEIDPARVPNALRTGALDIALVHEYDYVPAAPDPALETEPVLDETIFLAMASGAGPALPLAGNPLRCGAELPWIAASPDTLCYLMTIRLCQAAGFSPRIRHRADDFATVLALVAAGQGVALVPQLALADRPDGVDLLPLEARRRTLIACRRGSAGHPAVAHCAAAIRASTQAYLAAADPAPGPGQPGGRSRAEAGRPRS